MVPTTQPALRPPGERRRAPSRILQPQPVHSALVCVALPALAVSPASGQLTGEGLEGFYRDGRRILSHCEVRAAGGEPLVVQGRLTGADRARFVGTIRRTGDRGPDPEIRMERLRSADGIERITFRSSSAQPVRLPVEIRLGTDLAELGAVAAGVPGLELRPAVHGSGLRWSGAGAHAVVTAVPSPQDALASAGLLRWELDLPPGGQRTIELRAVLQHDPAQPSGAPYPGRPRQLVPSIPSPRTGPALPTAARRPATASLVARPARVRGPAGRRPVCGQPRRPARPAAARPEHSHRRLRRRRIPLAVRPRPGRGAVDGPHAAAAGHPAGSRHAAHARPHSTGHARARFRPNSRYPPGRGPALPGQLHGRRSNVAVSRRSRGGPALGPARAGHRAAAAGSGALSDLAAHRDRGTHRGPAELRPRPGARWPVPL